MPSISKRTPLQVTVTGEEDTERTIPSILEAAFPETFRGVPLRFMKESSFTSGQWPCYSRGQRVKSRATVEEKAPLSQSVRRPQGPPGCGCEMKLSTTHFPAGLTHLCISRCQ